MAFACICSSDKCLHSRVQRLVVTFFFPLPGLHLHNGSLAKVLSSLCGVALDNHFRPSLLTAPTSVSYFRMQMGEIG